MKGRHPIFKTVVAPLVLAAVFLPTLSGAVLAVMRGRGAAVYFNVYGLAISYISLLITVVAVVVVLGVAYVARLVYLWRYGRGEVTAIQEIQTPYTDPGDSK